MIVSANRRTDIPAFFSDWFLNRLKEGFVCVRNPMRREQISRIPLSPDVVDCIVFWTKNPIPLLDRLDALGDYPFYVHVTLTGYGHDIEPRIPDKPRELLPGIIHLADEIGPDRITWRYDPILFSAKYTPAYHLHAFERIASSLEGHVESVVISFVDIYVKNRRNMAACGVCDLPEHELYEFATALSHIARSHGMDIGTCAEGIDLAACGIGHSACIDRGRIERLAGGMLDAKKDPGQRAACRCIESVDIGTYNTCPHGCAYCYANYSPQAVKAALARYDPRSPLLCDRLLPGDVVTERHVASLISRQETLGI